MICAECGSIVTIGREVYELIKDRKEFKCNTCLGIKCRICAGFDISQDSIADTHIGDTPPAIIPGPPDKGDDYDRPDTSKKRRKRKKS